MEIVDPALKGDGEIDQILLSATKQDELRYANSAEFPPGESGDEQRDERSGAGPDRDPLRGREGH